MFEVGVGGKMRKTLFLCMGKQQSQVRLVKFIEFLGDRTQGDSDVFCLQKRAGVGQILVLLFGCQTLVSTL